MSHFRAIADYYDAENETHEMLQHDLPFFLGHLPRKRRLRVLDVACGTGRSSIPIAQAGHRVIGVDYAADMLKLAIRKRDSVGLTARQLEFVRQDALKLNLPDRFDWACIFFNTFLNFTTLAQQDALLRGIHRHLRPRGRLWIDIFHPNLDILAKPGPTRHDAGIFYVQSLSRTVYREAEITPNLSKQNQHIVFRYRWFEGDGDEKHAKVEFDLTWLFPRELQLLLERNGFTFESLYGNYDGSPVGNDSPRVIAVAVKR